MYLPSLHVVIGREFQLGQLTFCAFPFRFPGADNNKQHLGDYPINMRYYMYYTHDDITRQKYSSSRASSVCSIISYYTSINYCIGVKLKTAVCDIVYH